MKRTNPETGKFFKFGDIREDGKVFFAYKTRIKKTGYFSESWVDVAYIDKFKKQQSDYQKNSDKKKKYAHAWYLKNRDRRLEYGRNWVKNNSDKNAAKRAKQRSAKLQRTPPWLTEQQIQQIEEFYILARQLTYGTGVQHEVDHIVPLQGKTVSGLHVPWNLQVLTLKCNREKNNKFIQKGFT